MSWSELAVAQDGVITRPQLLAAGVSGTGLARMVAGGELVAVVPRVFLVRGAPLTFRARLWVATLSTDGVLGFGTAARLWGVIAGADAPIHIVLPHRRRVYPPEWIRLHRVPVAPSAVMAVTGLPITSRSWTLLDYLPTLRPAQRSSLADRSMQRGWIEMADIGRRLFDYPGRTGNRALRLLAQQLGDGAAAQSERVLHRLLRQAGITGWQPNYPIWHEGALIAVVDIALPGKKIAIEVDGWAYHSDTERFQRDRSRQNDLVTLGWTILRFTWADLNERPDYVRAKVAQLAA